MLSKQINFKSIKESYQGNSKFFMKMFKIFYATPKNIVKRTIIYIESILVFSEASYKYGKNEGSYHSRTLLVVGLYAVKQLF